MSIEFWQFPQSARKGDLISFLHKASNVRFGRFTAK
jgi:hypothetical protein